MVCELERRAYEDLGMEEVLDVVDFACYEVGYCHFVPIDSI